MYAQTKYVIQKHDAKKAGPHFDFRIHYLKRKALMSFALPKTRFPKVGEKLLMIRTPDHSPSEWLNGHSEIPDGEYGAGTYEQIQSGTLDILGWSSRFITFRIDGPKIKGKYSMIKYGKKGYWLLVGLKDNKENN